MGLAAVIGVDPCLRGDLIGPTFIGGEPEIIADVAIAAARLVWSTVILTGIDYFVIAHAAQRPAASEPVPTGRTA